MLSLVQINQVAGIQVTRIRSTCNVVPNANLLFNWLQIFIEVSTLASIR